MKKLFLFLFAAVLSMSVFAQDPTYSGKTKAQAIPYDWGKGIFVESTAGEGKWYVVMLRADQTDYPAKYKGPFDANGKTIESENVEGGLTNINVMVVNPLDESATIDVIAYIGDNETSRHFTLAKGGFKAMTFGAGMFIKMGIDRVYLYLVMDVTITPEEAQALDAVNVNVTPVESENVVSFVPDTFNWNNFPAKTEATPIPANKETWVVIDFASNPVHVDSTYKFYVEKADATPITIQAGLSYDCPASSIQEQSSELKSASTAKILDAAKKDILPGKVYIRIKSPNALNLFAEQVKIPAPDPETPALFNKDDAKEIKLYDGTTDTEYSLNNGQVYKVGYNTLKAEPNYYRQIEVTNNEDTTITIVGKATKTFIDGKAYSAVSKTVVIPSGQTYFKKIDKTMQSAVGGEGDSIWAIGPAAKVTFRLTQQPNDPEFCHDAVAFDWTDWNIQNGGFQWYEVSIADAKTAKADIVLTMETINPNEEANITVDLAAACAIGEPTQSYTGKSKSTTKTISYSLFEKNENSVMYVRVRSDKNIKVKAELLTTKTWNGAAWSGDGQAPTLAEAARIEGDLTIANGQTINALGLTLTKIPNITPTAYYTITIKEGGKLIVGEEGIKGSEVIEQIVVEDGGMLLISPKAGSNNKPFVTVKKGLFLGLQDSEGATLDEYHEFIALPIENRQAGVGQALRYVNWDLYSGWNTTPNGFKHTFEGYNVFTKAGDASYTSPAALLNVAFKGQLAANKNVKLDASQWGWFAFGNSWTAPIALEDIYDQIPSATFDEEAVHLYVNKPTAFNTYGISTLADNYYLPATKDVAQELGITEIKPMQGFFLYTEGSYSVTLDYSKVYNAQAGLTPAPAPMRKANTADNRTKVAAVLSNGTTGDFVYMIEGKASNAHKMISEGVAIYAEDGLGQVANDNLIGTILSIKTNDATEYTLSFTWLKGETMYLRDLTTGALIEMTADNKYSFTAEPNTTSARFQIVGRYNTPTGMENNAVIEGVNKRIENGNVVIIKNGVKYNVLGAQL